MGRHGPFRETRSATGVKDGGDFLLIHVFHRQRAAVGQRLIRLEDGEPVRFGADGSLGLRFGRYGALEAVPVAEADPDSLVTHSVLADPSYAFALSRLDSSDFAHTPIGVIRAVERPSYDDLMTAQIEAARQKLGDGDLAELLAGSDTWHVG